MIRCIKAAVWPLLVVVGCSGVREDRSIVWTKDGEKVGFQHAEEGVYVANKDGSGLTRIFQPDDTILATTTPLPSPTDGRWIFTTAKDRNGAPAPPRPNVFDPAGRVVGPQPIRYTCWLRPDAPGAKPTALFEAEANHLGYVAANLAVRWHPDGKRLLYVAVDGDGHTIREFDLTTKQHTKVFQTPVADLVFDWSPRGNYLTVRTWSWLTPEDLGGVWLLSRDRGDRGDKADGWWRVPDSQWVALQDKTEVLEKLRISQPAWTPDEARIAVVSGLTLKPDQKVEGSRLAVVTLADRKTQPTFDSQSGIVEVHWAPDGKTLGFVEQTAPPLGQLRQYVPGVGVSPPLHAELVRQFAGYSAAGTVAFTTPTGPVKEGQQVWSFLLVPRRWPRDVAWVQPVGRPARAVFGDMRVTFPKWSPAEEKLSLWLTFNPPYESVTSLLGLGGLRPGDPAAIIDFANGDAVSWMAVNADEELQIGHRHLLRREYAAAWEWYGKAEKKLPARTPPANWTAFLRQTGSPRQALFFEAYCLSKLGRDADAVAKRAEFERTFFPVANAVGAGDWIDNTVAQLPAEQRRFLTCLIHDLFVAEVFLSVDALDDGVAFFIAELRQNADPPRRLSQALALTQLLLCGNRRDDYLAQATQHLLPPLLEAIPAGTGAATNAANWLNEVASLFALVPLAHPEFVNHLAVATVARHLPAWEKARADRPADRISLCQDLVLRMLYQRLGRDADRRHADTRLAANPQRSAVLGNDPLDASLDRWIVEWRRQLDGGRR